MFSHIQLGFYQISVIGEYTGLGQKPPNNE